MEYNIVLKDNNEKVFRIFNWFLLCLHIVATGLYALTSPVKYIVAGCLICLGLYAVAVVLHLFYKKKIAFFIRFRFIFYAIYIAIWSITGVYSGSIVVFLIIVLVEKVRKRQTSIVFAENNITINKIFGKKEYGWKDFENILLKDGLLTLDFKSNHLLQAEITNNAVNEATFNNFCCRQLTGS